MSLFDDIHKQALAKRQQLGEDGKPLSHRAKVYLEHINPRLKQTFSYFNTLISDLNFLNEPVNCRFSFPGTGKVAEFLQGEYRIAADNSDRLTEITISFNYQRDSEFKFPIEDKLQAEQIRDYLHRHKVRFRHQLRHVAGEQPGVLFILTGQIPGHIRLYVDPESVDIILETLNLPELGMWRKSLRAHEINEAFLEALGRLLLHQENHLFTEMVTMEDAKKSKAARQDVASLKKQLKKKSHDPTFAQENKAPKPGILKRLFAKKR